MNLEKIVSDLNFISGREKTKTENVTLDVGAVEGVRGDEYEIALIDRGFDLKMPFVLNNEISQVVRSLFNPELGKGKNAVCIFDWVVKNIKYGERRRGRQGYRNSVEVFRDREGVCGEMATLYLVMIRTIGLRGSFVNVDVDYTGKRVNHACAMIDLSGRYGGSTLVDPAYRSYDVAHNRVKPLTDFEIFKMFNKWN
ncbi:transglutaminase domain-containing protein [Candidatus Woesearchaeota archaeon]|jgi:hypothetical protein|nr:transglutaminase domain-containing protein [Candidatus Woesearchaeota archaeon]